MKNDERGYIVIETIGAFMLFLFLVLSILTLVNIVALQARIHYALTQSCNAVSMYCYVGEVTGAAKHLQNLDSEASTFRKGSDEFKTDINELLDQMQSLNFADAYESGEAVIGRVIGVGEDAVDDPQEAIRIILTYGLDEARGQLTEALIRPLVGRYLSNGNLTGDEYLKSYNVIGGLSGLDFYEFNLFDLDAVGETGGKVLDSEGNIEIVVRYKVEYLFGALPLPFENLEITQSVKTKAWLNGSGEGYWR